jgi:hypothetical protein
MKKNIITLLLSYCILFSAAQSITQAEYFIDTDKGIGKNTKLAVPLFGDNSFTFHIDLTNVDPGFHWLYIRTKTQNNKWSLTVRKTIEVFPSQPQPYISKAEYFFDIDPGVSKATVVAIGTTNSAITKTFIADATGLPPGYHSLYIRTRDNDGRWSLSKRRSIEIVKSLDTSKIIAAEYFFSNDPGFSQATKKIIATPFPDGGFKFNIPYSNIPLDANTLFVRVADTNKTWSLTKLAKFSRGAVSTLIAGVGESDQLKAKACRPSLLSSIGLP